MSARARCAGDARLVGWLAEPAPVGVGGCEEIVRKAVVALHSGEDPVGFLARPRTAHLRRIRELAEDPPADPPARVARDHVGRTWMRILR